MGELTDLNKFKENKRKPSLASSLEQQTPDKSGVRILGSLYDENTTFIGNQPLAQFIADIQNMTDIGANAQRKAIEFAEESTLTARLDYLAKSNLADARQRDAAVLQLAEYTWEKAIQHESESLRASVVNFTSRIFGAERAASIIDKFRLTEQLYANQQDAEETLPENITPFQSRRKP